MIKLLSTILLSSAAMLAVPAHAQPQGPAPTQVQGQARGQTAFASERIGVTVRGSGPDVILIPGLSSSPEVWDSTIAAMPGYRYHLVHVSGFAGRAVGANGSGPVVAPVAEEIARYIREQRLERPAIVGHSLGGTLGMMVAARHPQLASKLMVVDMLPFIGAMFGGPGATAESVRPMAEQIRTSMAGATPAQRQASAAEFINPMIKTEGLRPLATRHSLESDATVSAQAFSDLITTDLTPGLRNVRVPMTVLWVKPSNAPLTEEQIAGFYRMAYAGVPHARVVNVPDSWHFIMWDNPTVFQRELKSFLDAR